MKLKAFTVIAALSCTALYGQTVEIKDAWVRTAMPGQHATGAFMTITAKDGAKLVGVTTPVAGVAEVHEMRMDGDIMRMRAVQGGLDLPAGKAVALKPGGYHLMLMDLKGALPKGGFVALTFLLKDANGVPSQLELKVPVALSAPSGGLGADPGHAAPKH
jgi:hypothetical protein